VVRHRRAASAQCTRRGDVRGGADGGPVAS
jgi:hypothetical protein